MWLAPADKSTLEEALFYFLRAVRDGRPQARQPLVVEQRTLHELYTAPHPDLQEAFRHCLDALLVEVDPDPERWGRLEVPASTLGMMHAARLFYRFNVFVLGELMRGRSK